MRRAAREPLNPAGDWTVKVYFDVAQLYYLPQYLPVHRELFRRGVQCKFLVYRNGTLGDLLVEEVRKLVLPYQLVEDEAEAAEVYRSTPADWVIFGNEFKYLDRLPEGTRSALVNHGAGVKSVGYKEGMNAMDVRFVDGTHHLAELAKTFPGRTQVLAGFPKFDPLFDGSLVRLDLGEMGLDSRKPTLLYAPTFYPSSIEKFPDRFPVDFADYNILVKFHFFSYTHAKYKTQRRKLQIWQEHPNVYAAPIEEYNILPFLDAADLLISDASSTLFEFAALNKPVVWCDFLKLRWSYRGPLRFRYHRRIDQKLLKYWDIAPHVKRYRQLRKTVRQQLEHPREYEPKRREYTDQLLGPVDGKASVRIADYLLSS